MSTVPAKGWYPENSNPKLHRFWEGKKWTEHTRAADAFANYRDVKVAAEQGQLVNDLMAAIARLHHA
jgi:uncharacterized protein DUF2510